MGEGAIEEPGVGISEMLEIIVGLKKEDRIEFCMFDSSYVQRNG